MKDQTREWTDVAAFMRAQRQLARMSLRRLAELTNVSDSYLSQVERGLYQPSPDILKAWAGALGIAPGSLYERMGWLDRETRTPGEDAAERADTVEQAVQRDARLTASQKKALLSMYRTLVGDE